MDTAQRAHQIVKEILSADIPKVVDPKIEEVIDNIVIDYAKMKKISRDRIPKAFFEN
jgi:trimethylamine:corrinoid methyltransferase-like protein